MSLWTQLVDWLGPPCAHEGFVSREALADVQRDLEIAKVHLAAANRAADVASQVAEAQAQTARAAQAAADQEMRVAKAVGEAVIVKHGELLTAHAGLTAQIDTLVASRDQARQDFEAYAESKLGVRTDLVIRAKYLVQEFQKRARHEAGEYKRHQVYAALLKEFPAAPKRDVGLAIEMALRAIDP